MSYLSYASRKKTGLPLTEIQAIRAHFGFTQAKLADYFSIPREQVAAAEQHRRNLPRQVLAKLEALVRCQSEQQASPEPAPAAEPPSAAPLPTKASPPAELLYAYQHTCRNQVWKLSHDLQKMRERAAQARHCLLALPALRALLPPPPAAPINPAGDYARDTQWLDWLERDAGKLLVHNGPLGQALPALRIASLTQEITRIAELLADTPLAGPAGQPVLAAREWKLPAPAALVP